MHHAADTDGAVHPTFPICRDARARALHEKAINAERQRPIAGVENV